MIKQEFKRGTYEAYYPISKLKPAKVNRDTVKKHADNFKIKLSDFGWMMPVVISTKGDVIEGHHRVESAKSMGQSTVPVYIVDWVDTSKDSEHLDSIISLNNGNKAWSQLDYLKAFSGKRKDYSIVYKAYLNNYNTISVGNLISMFFGKTTGAFKRGESLVRNYKFSLYLLKKVSRLVNKYGKKNIQAYCVREMCNIAHLKAYDDYEAMDFLFKEYEGLARTSHPAATSISRFKPLMELSLSQFNKSRDVNN